MTLKWGNYPRLSRQAQCNHKCPLKWKKEAGFSAREVHLKKTKLVFTIERHQKPRKIASFYKVKKKKIREQFLPLCLQKEHSSANIFILAQRNILMFFISSVHKESACQPRRHRLDPWSGKLPHATGQLSLCTTTAELIPQSPLRKYLEGLDGETV